jgi:hypothetical protein
MLRLTILIILLLLRLNSHLLILFHFGFSAIRDGSLLGGGIAITVGALGSSDRRPRDRHPGSNLIRPNPFRPNPK